MVYKTNFFMRLPWNGKFIHEQSLSVVFFLAKIKHKMYTN